MGQRKTSKGLDSLSRATDILSTLLAQQVRELNARQKAAKKEGALRIVPARHAQAVEAVRDRIVDLEVIVCDV